MPYPRPDDDWDPHAEADDAPDADADVETDPEGPQDIDLVDAGDDESETVACPHCGADVYEDADRCPRCGEWITAGGGSHWPLWVAGVAVLLILYLAYRSYGG